MSIKTFDDINNLHNLKMRFIENLSNINKACAITSFSIFYNGHNGTNASKELTQILKEATIEYFKTECGIALQELSNEGISVEREKAFLKEKQL